MLHGEQSTDHRAVHGGCSQLRGLKAVLCPGWGPCASGEGHYSPAKGGAAHSQALCSGRCSSSVFFKKYTTCTGY